MMLIAGKRKWKRRFKSSSWPVPRCGYQPALQRTGEVIKAPPTNQRIQTLTPGLGSSWHVGRGGEYLAVVERAEAERQQRGTRHVDDGSDHMGAAGREVHSSSFPLGGWRQCMLFMPSWVQTNARKSSAEIAAEERDFKRRRVKYRSSANKRTPTQVRGT